MSPRHSSNQNIIPFYDKRDCLSLEKCIIMIIERSMIPVSLRETVINKLHREHPGISVMKATPSRYVWCPKIN